MLRVTVSTIEDGVDVPFRANDSDAGLDIRAFLPDNPVEILPGENRVIRTGLKFGIPHGYMGQVCNRSSIASKRCLVVGAHIIDSGYAGEVFIDLHNIGDSPQVITNGERIAQLVIVPIAHVSLDFVAKDKLYEDVVTSSQRGEGGFGSTGI